MAVLIKGMKISKCCDECELLYDYIYCMANGERISGKGVRTDKKRLPNCPLIELPDHGDLIDRPVKHGKWILFDDRYYCSECDEDMDWKTYYCPNCGVKMDLEEKDDDT